MTAGPADSPSTLFERHCAAYYRVAQILAAAPGLADCAPALLDAVGAAVDASVASLWSVDGSQLRCLATRERDTAAAAFAALTRGMRLEPDGGVPGRIGSAAAPHWVENLLESGDLRAAGARAAGLQTSFGFPVTVAGDVAAIFEFFSRRTVRREDDVVRLFEGVGWQVAQFIGRARAGQERDALVADAEQARRDAEDANRAKEEFISVVSHELRTPLNTILGWSTILKNAETKPETRQRAVDAIERGAAAQARLIDDLMDISRIMRGTLAIEREAIDAAAPVRAAVAMMQPTAAKRGVSLDAVGLDRPAPVRADAARVRQIVLNLLSNALKFTPAGGAVTVSLLTDGSDARIEVRDTGIGIGAEFLPHVFEPFQQGRAPAAAAERGLGVGLAIVSHLAQAHGGTVRAASEGEDRGSTFTVTLPGESRSS